MTSETTALDAVLVSLRDPSDAMAHHELECFRTASGVESIRMISATSQNLNEGLAEADILFFGGSGAFSVLDSDEWVKNFLDFLPSVPEMGIPAWASCFAFQGLALSMGGEVIRDDSRQKLGACPVHLTSEGQNDPLFHGFPTKFYAQFGHHDHVNKLPTGVTPLATGDDPLCNAFRVNDSLFWGAQFHPELTKKTTLDRWNFYREKYEGENGDEIDRKLRSAPDTPEVRNILRELTKLARHKLSEKL